MPSSDNNALVCDIQRFSVHDGPGIRTNIYFKGCPLNCQWCHNPETISFSNELVFKEKECIQCSDCVTVCPQKAIQLKENKIQINRDLCDACGKCTSVCPSVCLELAATDYDADTLLLEVLKEKEFYGKNGGLTLSGGEPLIQTKLLRELLPKARAEGLHITVETAGHWSYRALNSILDGIDLILFDIKLVDSIKHTEYVGLSNELILANFRQCIADSRNIIARMPVIPGINNDRASIESIAELLHSVGMNEIVLLPYHSGGQSKIKYIDKKDNPLEQLLPLNNEQLNAVSKSFSKLGVKTLKS